MDKIADYRLVRSLGGGSHGEFFVAEPPARLGLDAEYVAVKVMAGQTQDDAFRRAMAERLSARPEPELRAIAQEITGYRFPKAFRPLVG